MPVNTHFPYRTFVTAWRIVGATTTVFSYLLFTLDIMQHTTELIQSLVWSLWHNYNHKMLTYFAHYHTYIINVVLLRKFRQHFYSKVGFKLHKFCDVIPLITMVLKLWYKILAGKILMNCNYENFDKKLTDSSIFIKNLIHPLQLHSKTSTWINMHCT